MLDLPRRTLLQGAAAIAAMHARAFPAAIAAEPGPPLVAAAADLNFALTEIADGFARDTGAKVKLSFGSSGTFATQIRNGAPFQIFFSADEAYVQALAKDGLTDGDGTLYAIGRIGLFAPKGSPLSVDGELRGLADALRDGRIGKFAIANPEHAPYGRAAQAALEHAGLWQAIRPKLVLGDNVSQATQFATSGSADGGIIPLSLATAKPVAEAGTFALIPAEWHPPLRQRMVLLKGAGATARAFHDYARGEAARVVFARYGFVLPGEAAPAATN